MKAYFYNLFQSIEEKERSSNLIIDQNASFDLNKMDSNKNISSDFLTPSDWEYVAFMIRVRPSIGFNLPGIFSLKLLPETEFYWSNQG